MDAFGSDRKLSELGLDLCDFPDPLIDPAELFPTIQQTSVDHSDSELQHHHHHHHINTHSNHHHQNTRPAPNTSIVQLHNHHQHLHRQTPSSGVFAAASSRLLIDPDEELHMDEQDNVCYALRRHQCDQTESRSDSIEDEYDSDFKLIDVGEDDDDEVVLDSGWLDKIFDDDRVRNGHVSCGDDDVIGSQHVSDEHSYSLANGTSDLEYSIKIESNEMADMETGIFEMIDPDLAMITGSDITSSIGSCSEDYDIMTSRHPDVSADLGDCGKIKTEPLELANGDSVYSFGTSQSAFMDRVDLPLTPPCTSSSSSDSEAGGLSPHRSPPSSPYHVPSSGAAHHHSYHSYHHRDHTDVGGLERGSWTNQQSYFSNTMSSSGMLVLSEEEKRTLVAEGYPVPSKLPLTKQEEKNLKKIRRKIKNKISAQESRRKKKEYLETLEKKVECVSIENINLRKKLDLLESNNRSLMSQLQKLQSLHKTQSAICISVK